MTDSDWLDELHARLSAGVGTPSESREWLRISKHAQPLFLNEAVSRLFGDPRRDSEHSRDTWLRDVARLRSECDNAIGWADMKSPPKEWVLWAREGGRT
jgi:hypothetical protein